MESEAVLALMSFGKEPILRSNWKNGDETTTETAAPEAHWPPVEISSSAHIPIEPMEQPQPADTIESPSKQRMSGRKRPHGINSNDDVVEEKGGRRSSSRKTRTSYSKKPHSTISQPVEIDSALQLDKEMLSKLPNAPATDFFEEETSWRFHNPAFPSNSPEHLTIMRDESIPSMAAAVSSDELQPLPPPPPLPESPNTGFCEWSFDETSRVLLAKFLPKEPTGKVVVCPDDELFLFRMMERDDITVISEGLADEITDSLWTKEYITGCIGSEYHHKFRAFQKKSRSVTLGDSTSDVEYYEEQSGWYSMKVASYFEYLEKRSSVQDRTVESNGSRVGSEKLFHFVDSNGNEHCIDAEEVSLYMIDVDVIKLLPKSFEDFQNNFKLSSILPGGQHCMMNAVNINGRPFMGPNMYLTPPSSFTHFHQDGHGTVDSGHLCLSGYNEVVMLRRLPERHKCRALDLLTGSSHMSHSALYGLPHRDDLDPSLGWPTKENIGKCKEMGYCPSVFVLKPGQMVHINKGRLHAFRKLSPSSLHDMDCHHDLRQNLQQSIGGKEQLCLSIAWDWMFKGVTSEGINRELSSILECVRLNREHNLQSLAIPEAALLFLAKENVAKHNAVAKHSASLIQSTSSTAKESKDSVEPDPITVLRGILTSLKYVVHRHRASVNMSNDWSSGSRGPQYKWAQVSVDKKPNTWQDPGTFSLDPYGAGDFFCKFCMEELSNIYMHCDGCEKLLNKDFNICSNCHMEGKYKVSFYQIHPFSTKRFSVLNHTGSMEHERSARCPCRNGQPCNNCNFCTGCSCKCHQHFTLYFRFMGIEDELQLLSEAEKIVGADTIPHADETTVRLLSLLSGTDNSNTKTRQGKTRRRGQLVIQEENEVREGHQEQAERVEKDAAKTTTKKKSRKKPRSVMSPVDFNSVKADTAVTVTLGNDTSSAIVKEIDMSKMTLQVLFDGEKEFECVDFNSIRSITSPMSDNFQRRCAFLAQEDIKPIPPSSAEDLSRASIAYTAPRGTVLPPDELLSSSIGKLNCKAFSAFMKKARSLESPTTEALFKLLPRAARIREDEVRHLYRNFADCQTIEGDASIIFSRREIDIVNYYTVSGKVPRDMATLMPYRAEKDLRKLTKTINDMGLCLSEEYVNMLHETVGMLDQLETAAIENKGATNIVVRKKPSVPVKYEQLQKQRELRESPELTDEERKILPQWAVSKTVEWRKLVSDGDPRPIFGCDWCGPKIRDGYDGPFLVNSEVCPTCNEFQKEGYYTKMTAGGSKKTFCLGNETVWWSNLAYLKGTTDKVAKKHKTIHGPGKKAKKG